MCSVPCACGGTSNNRSPRRSVRSSLPFFFSLESGVPTPPNLSFHHWALAKKHKPNNQEQTMSVHHHHLDYPTRPNTTQHYPTAAATQCFTYPWATVQWNLGGVFSTPRASPKCSFPTFHGKNKTRHCRRQSNAHICRFCGAVRPLLVLGWPCWDY